MFAHSSLLFVPGSRPDRFAKAKDAGAGLTVIDLEDAVSAPDKTEARDAALTHVSDGAGGWAIRINPVATAAGVADLAALGAADALPETLLLPMAETARDCEIVAQVLGERCPMLVPLVETPRALRNARAIAAAPRVAAVMFGGGDFAGVLGVTLAWEPLLTARQQLVLACAEAEVPAIDVPFIHLDDADGLAEECARAEALGFAAKAAIHPRQVAAIEGAFVPGEDAVNEAAEALQAYAGGGNQVMTHNGRMLEAPIIKRYQAIVAKHEANKSEERANA
ncbi:MAG: CoA ester lyase [Parerythrobacter sp.]